MPCFLCPPARHVAWPWVMCVLASAGLLSTLGADLSSPAGSGDPIPRVTTIAEHLTDTSRSGSAVAAAADATTNTSPVKSKSAYSVEKKNQIVDVQTHAGRVQLPDN